MATQSLKDLYVDELRDLLDAEQQILQTLPAMTSAATSPALKRVFQDHLEQTRVQTERLELIFRQLGQPGRGRRCAAMSALLREGQERLQDSSPGEVRDAALIGAAQRVEHYEIAAYGVVRTYAQQLGAWDQADLLQQTLEEEGEADHRLTAIAEGGINEAARRRDRPLSEDSQRWGRLRYAGVDDLPRKEYDFTGVRVRNAGGDDLGTLDGFIVEAASGRPLYYVIDSGGWFIGGRYLVPVGKGQFESASRTLRIDVGRERLQSYPEFNTNAFLSMSDDQARGYERRLLSAISPEAVGGARYWESYDRLPEYAPPSWLTTPTWGPTVRSTDDIGAATVRPEARPLTPERQPDAELIRAREESLDTGAEPADRERIRGAGDEGSRRERSRERGPR